MRHITHSIGILTAISVSIFATVGCGAGTGQNLSSPTLASRANGDGTTDAAAGTSRSAASVLPAKRLGLFLTDAAPKGDRIPGNTNKPAMIAQADTVMPATDYAHVYVTVNKIELLTADDQEFPIWADDAGRTVDLTTLRDAGGERVALLGGVPAPGATGKKTYKRVRITLGKGITFLKRGETTAPTTPISDSLGRDDEGRPVLTITLDRPRDLGTGKEDLIVAFDRSAFTFADGRVTPSLREGRSGISTDPARQEPLTVAGAVSESTAGGDGPDRTFALTPDSGAKGENLVVAMRSSAIFFRADGKPSPSLTDGARVAVRGVLQPSTKRVIASSVALLPEDEKPGEVARITGDATGINADASSLTLATDEIGNLPPTRSVATVVLDPDAALRSSGGLIVTRSEFLAAVTKAGSAFLTEAEGDYEPTTGVLTAKRARLIAIKTDEKGPRAAAVTAIADSVSESGKSLMVVAPLAAWDGIVPPASGKSWTVNTTIGTNCFDTAGKPIALADLLTAAKNIDKNAVQIVGMYAGGTITATRLQLAPAPVKEKPAVADAKPGHDKVAKTAPTDGNTPALPSGADAPVHASDSGRPAPATP